MIHFFFLNLRLELDLLIETPFFSLKVNCLTYMYVYMFIYIFIYMYIYVGLYLTTNHICSFYTEIPFFENQKKKNIFLYKGLC